MTVTLAPVGPLSAADSSPLTDLFGDPLRPPTRRERHRVAVVRKGAVQPHVQVDTQWALPQSLWAPLVAVAGQAAAPAPADPPAAAASTTAALCELHPRLWRATELGRADARTCASGFALLDAQLPGGGWPTRGLTELLLPQPGCLEWRLLAPALALRVHGPAHDPAHNHLHDPAHEGVRPGARRRLLLIAPPHAPHPRGLAAWGLAAAHCLWINVDATLDRLWALEQALKADADDTAAVLAWLPQVRPEQLRRLQTLAARCRAPVFVLRPTASTPLQQASAAPLRLRVQVQGSDWTQLRIDILKRRGPALEAPLLLHAVAPSLQAVIAHMPGPAAVVPHTGLWPPSSTTADGDGGGGGPRPTQPQPLAPHTLTTVA